MPLSLGEGLGERSLKAKPMQINAIFKNENYKNNQLIFYTPPVRSNQQTDNQQPININYFIEHTYL